MNAPTIALRATGRLAAVATAATATVLALAAPASAHTYDYADPSATGCSSGATTVDQTYKDGMTFQLRWSSSCQTNWVRILNYPGTVPASQRDTLWMDVQDTDRAVLAAFTGSTGITGTRWGDMVYSPGSNCAQGLVNYKGSYDYDVVLESSGC